MDDRIMQGLGRRKRGFVTWVLALSVGMIGCDRPDVARFDNAERVADAEPLPFPGSPETLEGLALQVLESLAAGDTAALERLRLTEQEHNGAVWPELPASRPEIGFPVDLAWENIELRNRRSLARILPVFGGLDLELETVQCRGGTRTFATFRVLTDCWTIFTLGDRDELLQAQLFKDVLVRGGGHKVFRYHETRPIPVAGGAAR